MALFVNALLGIALVGLALGSFYGQASCLAVCEGIRSRLRAVLGEQLIVHDWIFALVFLGFGSLALASAFMRIARDHHFWVLM